MKKKSIKKLKGKKVSGGGGIRTPPHLVVKLGVFFQTQNVSFPVRKTRVIGTWKPAACVSTCFEYVMSSEKKKKQQSRRVGKKNKDVFLD